MYMYKNECVYICVCTQRFCSVSLSREEEQEEDAEDAEAEVGRYSVLLNLV